MVARPREVVAPKTPEPEHSPRKPKIRLAEIEQKVFGLVDDQGMLKSRLDAVSNKLGLPPFGSIPDGLTAIEALLKRLEEAEKKVCPQEHDLFMDRLLNLEKQLGERGDGTVLDRLNSIEKLL